MESPSQDVLNEPAPLPHKLAAILYSDVEGYSRLTGADEAGTHRTLSAYLDLFAETIKAHRGDVKHYAGDAVPADFTTASEALNCAVAFQKTMKEKSETVAPEKRVQFRIGLNLGEVIEPQQSIRKPALDSVSEKPRTADWIFPSNIGSAASYNGLQ